MRNITVSVRRLGRHCVVARALLGARLRCPVLIRLIFHFARFCTPTIEFLRCLPWHSTACLKPNISLATVVSQLTVFLCSCFTSRNFTVTCGSPSRWLPFYFSCNQVLLVACACMYWAACPLSIEEGRESPVSPAFATSSTLPATPLGASTT
jgi:hypothetical protein